MIQKEYPTERRIMNLIRENRGAFTSEEVDQILYAYDCLKILEKTNSTFIRADNKRTFLLKLKEYQEYMNQINLLVKKIQGLGENAFTDINSYEKSSEDYDYYYELKTPSQIKTEEEARRKRTNQSHDSIDVPE